jgi:ribose-phosphate pyrophosphokinase
MLYYVIMTSLAGRKLCIMSGRTHPELANEVARELGIDLCPVKLDNFANGEISCQITKSVRGSDVFIIQSHSANVNDAIMEQAIMIDAAKRASAASVTAVCPFLGYARQDRKSAAREPITARLVVDLLAVAGADRIMSIDLHSGQTQGFFNGQFDHIVARPTLIKYIKENFKNIEDLIIVSPDAGRVKSAEHYGKDLNCDIAIIHKQRSTKIHNQSEAKYLFGDVKGKTCIIIDDMIDTAGTLCSAAELLVENGAKEVYGMATHGVLSNPASERIDNSVFKEVIVTSTLPKAPGQSKKITTISIAPLLAASIDAVFRDHSLSAVLRESN